MSKPKKKEYWLERWRSAYALWAGGSPEKLGKALGAFPVHVWHSTFAPPESPLRMRSYSIQKISIAPTKTGFTVRAIGKPEKI